MTTSRSFWSTFILAITLLWSVPTIAAQVVVLSSTLPTLQPGALVDSTMPISLPTGGMVMINELSGKTRTITGPYDGPIGGTTDGPTNITLISSLGRLVASRHAEQSRLGAVRAAPDQQLHDPVLVTVTNSSTQCIGTGGQIRMWRPSTMDADSTVTITDQSSGVTAHLVWHKGLEELNWPGSLPLEQEGRYLVQLDISPRPIELVLRRMPDGLKDGAEQVAWMEEAGCRRQALLLLERLLKPGG